MVKTAEILEPKRSLPEVWLVDDDVAFSQILVNKCQHEYCFKILASGEECLKQMEQRQETQAERPHIILLDIGLPGINGLELCRKIRGSVGYSEVPIIILSGILKPDEHHRVYEHGGDDFLSKPYELKELKAKINLLLKKDHELRDIETSYMVGENMAKLGLRSAELVHNLKNKMTVLKGHIQLLNNEVPASKSLVKINRLCDEMVEMMNVMLKANRESADLKTVEININSVIEQEIQFLQDVNKFKVQNIDLRLTLGTLPTYMGVRIHFAQIFCNLIKNAIEAMSDSKIKERILSVKSEHCQQTQSIIVTISDTGVGIAEKDKSKLFRPFFSTKVDSEGTGLGLEFVKRMTEFYGGSIDVESALSKGTTFTVRFPVK